MRRWFAFAASFVVVLVVAIQFIPYGRDHSNPPVTGEVPWPDTQTEQLFAGACADCHSNETAWPWYTSVAPVSWLVQRDVDEGREAFNVSTYPSVGEGEEAAETVLDGEMPPFPYPISHPGARLSDAERRTLADGLAVVFGDGEGDEDDENDDENDDDD